MLKMQNKLALEAARAQRGNYYIPSYDQEFDDIMKNAERMLERRSEPAMPCKAAPVNNLSGQGTPEFERTGRLVANEWERIQKKTFFTPCAIYDYRQCALESQRIRTEATKGRKHQCHIAQQGYVSMTPDSLVHKLIPILQTMNVAEARAALDKEWGTCKCSLPGMKQRFLSKHEVIRQAKKGGKQAHFATLMDSCHLKNSELDKTFGKYNGRIVLRGIIDRDAFGNYAVLLNKVPQNHIWRQQKS